jgi:hypothetical protein
MTPEHLSQLARAVRLSIPTEDLAAVAAALDAQAERVQPLLERDATNDRFPLSFDPRWLGDR